MNFRCCIAWGSREKCHYIWDGEYQEIINEKCLNCTLLYPYQKNTYLHINTWICYTCMYSLSLGNLHQWFHWHTTWIFITHKDIVHSKEKKLPGKQEQVKTRLLEMTEEEHAVKMRIYKLKEEFLTLKKCKLEESFSINNEESLRISPTVNKETCSAWRPF